MRAGAEQEAPVAAQDLQPGSEVRRMILQMVRREPEPLPEEGGAQLSYELFLRVDGPVPQARHPLRAPRRHPHGPNQARRRSDLPEPDQQVLLGALKVLRGDKRFLFRAGAHAQRAVDWMVEAAAQGGVTLDAPGATEVVETTAPDEAAVA
jgi:hypothetical protein